MVPRGAATMLAASILGCRLSIDRLATLYREPSILAVQGLLHVPHYGRHKFGPKPGIPIGRDISYSTTAGSFGYGSVLPVLANPNCS